MVIEAGSWPPSPEDLYLDGAQGRPLFQGDVFDDVPFVKARSALNPARDPNLVVDRRPLLSSATRATSTPTGSP